MIGLAALMALGAAAASPAPDAASCSAAGRISVEVLGSGGPIADDGRAGSGYIVWIDGHARLLIDAGGGVFLRFAEAGARIEDLDAILISHFHADHVADLIALLKSGYFADRERALLVAGPAGNDAFPGTADFLNAHLAAERGAYRYLSGYLDGSAGLPMLKLVEVAAQGGEPSKISNADAYAVAAVPVHHGHVPALAYIVSAGERTVVFGGDQSALSDVFDEAVAGLAPDLLIAHHAIAQAPGQPRGLHRDPASIGALAEASNAGRLVLSHNMQRALLAWETGLAAIRQSYKGPVDVADDHSCFPLLP